MNTTIKILGFLLFSGFGVYAQSDLDIKAEDLLHQIYLDEAIQSIDSLYYEKDGEKINGTLTNDKKRIILHNYYKKGRVKAVFSLPTGEQKSISRSSCFIDPVIPM